MEKPYSGRTTVNERTQSLEIIIPAKRNWGTLIFISFWLIGWLLGFLFVLASLLGLFESDNEGGFSYFFRLFWIVGWAIGGVFAIKYWWWMLNGQEVIKIQNNRLTHHKQGALFLKPKEYGLRDVKDIRLGFNVPKTDMKEIISNAWNHNSKGSCICFDYGMKTINMAHEIDEAEIKVLLEKIKMKMN